MQGWQVFFEIPGKPPVELREGESIIGRSRSSTVHIPETTVSRQHARIVVHQGGKVEVSDLGSSNGTFVNGEKVVGEKQIQEGDRLMVGDAELLLRVLAPAEPADATVRVSIPGPGPIPEATVRQELPPPAASRPPAPVDPPPSPQPVAVAPAAPVTAPTTPPPTPARPSGEVLSSLDDLDKMTPASPLPRSAAPAAGPAPVAGVVRPAGFWIRCLAYLIDAVPFVVLWLVAVVVPFISEKLAFVSFLMMLLMLGWSFLLLLYWPATQGTTFGKKKLGLAIVTDTTTPGQGLGWGKAFVRLIGYMVNSLTGGIGYLLIAFTSKKQGLHDMIAGTFVVRTR